MADPFKIVDKSLFLMQYVMEAVGFSEFVYEEAVQNAIRVLKSISKEKDGESMVYMRNKFLEEVYTPAWNFHKQYGPLNPFTYWGFECFYNEAWKDFQAIMHPTE